MSEMIKKLIEIKMGEQIGCFTFVHKPEPAKTIKVYVDMDTIAETLDRAIKAMQRVVDDLNMRTQDGVVRIGTSTRWELNEALTELKKMRGEV